MHGELLHHSAGEVLAMRYACGLYGGSFNPLHLGHVRCMLEAANRCERLLIVISAGENRGEIGIRQRYRWVYEATKHFPHVELHVLEDDAPTKAEYGREQWFEDARKVKEWAGQKIDAVFCGSDYGPDSFWAQCYPEAELVVLARDGISSTAVRENPMACWDMLPSFVRPYYAKKVLLIGGESTGKSTLTISLARRYNTCWLEEVGRDISMRSGTDQWMLQADFTDILLQHKMREIEALQRANRVLIEDTDCLITLFYLNFLEGDDARDNVRLAEAIAHLNSYDLILYLQPDVAFVQDGDRSEVIAADRETYSRQIEALYHRFGFRVHEIRGDYQTRYEAAVELIDAMLEGHA